MIKIAHFADIHIFNDVRHDEYRKVFDKIYIELNKIKPDRIVICGDLFESKLTLTNESKLLAGELLNNLSKISPVKITIGNHDLNFKNLSRIDSIETIVKLINNPNIEYFNKSGIYNDGIINWVVYHHPEKNIDPWLNQSKDNSKIYIGLFHDPIQGCSTDLGKVFDDSKYKDVSYFKNNDFVMLGDIHKRQYFRKNKSMAYCGSTIQKDFGESIDNHGFLLWKIESLKNFEVNEYNIKNDHAFVNFYINELTDYDNLQLESSLFEDMDIKVHWKDYSSNINTENEKKIRDYIKSDFNTTKVRFEKTYVYNDIISSEMLSESLDLTDIQVQNDVFKEYLKEQKYKKDDIEEILKIDDIINSRLHLNNQKTNISWSIDKFWFSNFKSYGDNNLINWNNIPEGSIIQITGLNQQGKTTILDALTYILYGKTTTTTNRQEFGDSRYINNKRDLDYCLGGAVLDIDGEKFIIQRKTERIWNRNKTNITSCPTTLDFYSSDEINEKNKLTGDVKKNTQDKLDLILGDFNDFIRLSYTNADNLNQILSENRSVFMDNIIRDAGLDVFELKLEEFKQYKKELNEERLIVDIQESEENIEKFKKDIEEYNLELESNKKQIEEFEEELKAININRDDLNKKINNIDSSLSNFDESININSINNYNNNINEFNINITILDRDLIYLPTSFDNTNILSLKVKLKEINDKINNRKEEITKIRTNIVDIDNKKDKVLSKIRELKENEIKKLVLKISDNDLKIQIIKNQKENIINEELNDISLSMQKIQLEKNDISNRMKLSQKDGINLKNFNDDLDKEIEILKNSSSCPTCGREYDKNDPKYSEHLSHLDEKIENLKNKKSENLSKINKLLEEYKKLKGLLQPLELKETELSTLKENISQGNYSDIIKEKLKSVGSIKNIKQENSEIEKTIEEIKNNIFENTDTLRENVSKGQQLLESLEKKKNDNLLIIKNIESELKNFNVEGIENDIQNEEKIKDNFELRKQKESQKNNLLLSIENFKLKIKDLESEITKYQEFKSKIEENKNTQFSIDRIDEKILIIKENIKDLSQENIDIEKGILLKDTEIDDISTRIRKYLKQKKKDELIKEYQKCISRDGIPLYLLKKSLHLINNELNQLLSNVNFTLYFDENLNLKMSADDRLDVSQNAIESSGKERVFCSLALKMALRQINVKSKSNFLFLDEVMGKFIDQSIQEFTDFLEDLKNKVDKIIIIEHVHPINFDALIRVEKQNHISTLSLE